MNFCLPQVQIGIISFANRVRYVENTCLGFKCKTEPEA